MLVIALIALVQLAVLVMILAVVTSPSETGAIDPVEQPSDQINRLEHLTIEAMMTEAERSQYQVDDNWNQ